MKSEWRVTSQMIGNVRMYAPYRLKDVNTTDHAGNREEGGAYVTDRDLAVKNVAELNAEETKK